jgi:hypothetical protein
VKQPGSVQYRLLIVLSLTFAGIMLLIAPVAWATPRQSPHHQTIPPPTQALPSGPGEEPSDDPYATDIPAFPTATTITPTLSPTSTPAQPVAPTATAALAEATNTPSPTTSAPLLTSTPTPAAEIEATIGQTSTPAATFTASAGAEAPEPSATPTSPSAAVAPFSSSAVVGYCGLLGGVLLIVIGLLLIYRRSGAG